MKRNFIKICSFCLFLCFNVFLIPGLVQASDTTAIQCGNCHQVHAGEGDTTAISFPIHQRIIIDISYTAVGGCIGCHNPTPATLPTASFLTGVCSSCHPNNGVSHPVSTIINVGLPNGCYTKIDSAVYLTTPGKTINVLAGTYDENVTVNKTLTLIGAGTNQTFVTAQDPNYDVFKVTAGSVKISGFNISGATGYNMAGINLINSSGAISSNISQNEISGNSFGIYIGVNDNNGVFDSNNLYNNSWGIYGNRCSNSTISNNTVQNGITLINESINNLIQNNAVVDNGITLRLSCSNNTIVNNTLSDGFGINVNTMWEYYPDTTNLIYHNNFLGTSAQIYDGNPAVNKYYHPGLLEGNYWSNYTGLDNGVGTGKHATAGDGIGDTIIPHPGANFDLYPYTAENGWDNPPLTGYICENCHYVHKSSDSTKTKISQPIHQVMMIENPGCVPLCHPRAGITNPPPAVTNVCFACHSIAGDTHPDSASIVSTIINVGTGGAYKTIQTAVNLTTPGKTINVLAGTYNENVLVNKRLTLSGAGINQAFVNALDSTDDAFEIAADSVNISGFNIGGATGTNKAGIYLNGYSGANNSNVSQNRISGSYFGINAVNSNNSVFDNNNLYANLWGLYANPIRNCTISNNTADSNTQNGITLINGSTNNIMQGNAVSNNTSGIVLRMDCINNTLVDNILINNGTGLNINIMSFAPDTSNVIYHNNIKGNATQVTDNNPVDNKYYSPSLLEGNYWSNYFGVDNGSGTGKHAIAGDGIGDTLFPHPGANFDLYPFIAENEWNNTPPILDPIGNKSVNEGDPLQFTVTGSDPDGDTLTLTAVGLPQGAVFISDTFTWTPNYSQSGTYPVTFTATDGTKTDSESITITVQDVLKPDLIMTVLSTASTKVAPGSTLTVSNTAKNQGATASGAFAIAFHLSQDTTYGGSNDVVFTTARNVSSLNAGASSAASTTLTIPAGTPLGNYYICAFVDKDGVISEMNELNNTRSTLIPIEVAGADLVITAVSSPSTGITGTSIPVSSTVLNQGTGSISSFTIGIYLSTDATIATSDTRIGTRTVSSLNGTASNTATTSLLIPTSLTGGTYYIGAIADYNSTRIETNETNNALAGNAIDITSGLDAIMTAVSGPSNGFTGASISVTSTVKNQGVANMTASYVGLYISTDSTITTSDTRLGTRYVASLAAGASSTVTTSVAISSTFALGQYYIGAIADYSNVIKESDETNNSLVGNTINIVPGADAIVTAVSGPSSAVTGTSISITSTVKNQGVGNMSSSYAGLYISTDSTITTSDRRLGTRYIASLAAGASNTATASFVVPSTLAAGQYYIGAITDYSNLRIESDETNNALAGNTIDLTKP